MSRSEPPYSVLATRKTPALVIYLLDLTRSMNVRIQGERKIDTVMAALSESLKRMISLSTRGNRVLPRYRLAMYGYHENVVDLLGGVRPINAIGHLFEPVLAYGAETASGFEKVEQLLELELPALQDCPAPLVCHLTDGINRGSDPQPVVERIKRMSVNDGPVLVENIYISRSVLKDAVTDPRAWPGVTSIDQLETDYARKLFEMSSPIPASYVEIIHDLGYQIDPQARMMLPGDEPDLVKLGFVMSTVTGARR